jgi:hypothetical protein
MQEVELTTGRLWRLWWALFWRGFVVAVPCAIVLGMLSGMIIAVSGIPNFTTSPLFSLGEIVILLPLYPLILRWAFRTKFSDFRVAFVAPEETHPTG